VQFFLKLSGNQFQLNILCWVFLYECHKNSFENYQNRCQNQDFSYSDCIFVRIRYFQAKFGESQQDQDSWTVCLLLWGVGSAPLPPLKPTAPPPHPPNFNHVLKHAKEDWGQSISFFNASIISPITTADMASLI